MIKKIKKGLLKVKKEINKQVVMDPTPKELILGTTAASATLVTGILIAVGGAPIVFPALLGAGITVGSVTGITYLVEKINELDENTSIIENNHAKCQTKKIAPTCNIMTYIDMLLIILT